MRIKKTTAERRLDVKIRRALLEKRMLAKEKRARKRLKMKRRISRTKDECVDRYLAVFLIISLVILAGVWGYD